MLDWLKATGRIFALFLGVFALSSAAQAGPEDGRIVNGSGSISQSGTHTDIRQNSDFLATHWGSFNIAAHESVQAHQPAASSRLLIRVDGGSATNIAGSYTSNGITILENRNGVQFSRGAIVNVGGLLATSSRISGAAGANWQLDGTGGAVVNHGQIAAGAGGVVLAAVRVENHGKITAQGSDVSLGAGSAFTVDFAGSLVGFEVKKAADGASVVHDGVIESQGGIVSLSAQEAQAVRTNVVSVGGVVKATRLERRGGVVYLSGGTQGIAEVSGDVSASKKVQTTGEYVVVKENAVVKAPKILVGGDFQGGGDVQTAKRTLVERGALLDAGAGGRVIVWSDDVTWFNGDISAPGGFAEVSGKETLASVHLAGIDVGELLLDPADIIIAAAGNGDAVTADIAAADPGMTLTLDVATINTFAGALSLAASDTIMVDGEINKPTGNLTLIAGGVLTINANITTSAGDLALTGASIALTAATTTLTGGAISLTGAISETADTRNLTINASGILTLNSDITLPTGGSNGRLEITAFRVNLPSAIALAPSRLRVVFNDPAAVNFETSFDGAGVAGSTFPGIESDLIRTIFTYAPRDCGGEAVCELTSMDNVDEIGQGFRLSPTLTARTSITITGRGFVLTFGGTGPISITAPTVSIESRAINIGGRNFTITANGGTLTLGTSITTTGNITLSSTGANAGITLMFNTGLEGRDISITGAIGGSGGSSFTATASGVLTLNDNINTGASGLVLTGMGGITFTNAAGLTLRGGAVRLTGAIDVSADNLPLTIEAQQGIVIDNDINLGVGRLELIAGLDDGAVAFVNVHTPDPDITITAGSFLWAQDAQFNASDTPPANFVLPDEVRIEGIYFGTDTSAVDPAWLDVRQFQGVRYMLGDGTGDIVVPQTVNALESITLNAAADSTISFGGTGAITLTAPLITITGEAIIIGDGRTLTITAEGGTLTLNVDAIELSGTATAGSVILSAAAIVNDAALTLDVPTVSITQDGEFGAAAPFTFPAAVTTLNLSTQAAQTLQDWMIAVDRDLTITSSANVRVAAAIGSMVPNRNIGAGALSLTSTEGLVRILAGIATSGNLTLNGSTGINFNGGTAKAFGGADVTLSGAARSNRDLNILATGSRGLTLGGDINAGASDISLAATVGDIILGGDVVLTGGAVSLVGGVDGTMMGGNHGLRVNANDDITLTSSSIDLGAGALNLRAGEDDTGNIVLAGTASTLTVGDLTLQQVSAFGDDLFATASRASGAVALRLRTAALQPIEPWMRGLGNGAFSLRGVEGVTLTSIITPAALTRTGGSVDLQATTISLGDAVTGTTVSLTASTINVGGDLTASAGNLTLQAATISLTADVELGASGNTSLTGAISGNQDLTLRASGDVILNSNINIGTTGTLAFAALGVRLGSDIVLDVGTLTLSAVQGTINGSANNANFTVNASASLTIGTVNLGTGNLVVNNMSMNATTLSLPATWTAGDITLTGAISSATDNLTIVASGVLTLNNDINLGTGDLDINAMGGTTLGGDVTLDAEVTRLTGAINTTRNFTVMASGALTLNSNINGGGLTLNGASIILGGDITLTGSGLVRLTGAINESAASPGSDSIGGGDSLTITARGTVTLNSNINLGSGDLSVIAGEGTAAGIMNDGTARRIQVNSLFLQSGAFNDNLFTTNSTVSGSVDLRITAAMIDQTIHPWMAGLGNGDFSLAGVDGVVLARINLLAADLPAGLTRSAGVIDLRATRIILRVPLTGTEVNLRTDDIGGGSTNPVAIHATEGDITATRITDTGAAAAGVPTLTVANGFTLTQTTAFGALDTLPFTFTASEITAITISTRSAQTVQDWMLAVDRDLTITSSANVRVAAAIGSMVPNRNIGAGALTLTSTGAAVRIFADISTTRRLTLSGVIGGINFNNRAAKTLTGLSVTLRGAAVSNRALTITASSPSGFVTISGGINTGTSDLSLSTGSGGGIVLDSGDVELRGGVITLGGVVRGDNNSGLSVFANGNIILGGEIALGSGALTLSAGENGTGNISFLGIAQNQLTVGALTLRQSDAFGETLFASGSTASGAVSLRLRTAVDQPVHPWMTGLGDGAFSLRGVEGVTLTSITTTAALTRSDGPVDLRATTINLGGDVTGNIVGSSDVELVGLTLTATTINLGGDVTANIGLASNANVRLTGVINGSANNRNFSATASRSLTISNDINIGMGTLALTGVGLGVTGSILLDGDITFTGGEIRFIGDFRPSAADINPNFTVNASTSISIRNVNLGTGNLILNNTGATATALGATNTTWTARNITLTGALDASADNRNLNIIASGVLTLNDDINLGERNLNINAMGGITLGGNVTLTSRVTILRGAVDGTNGNHNFTIMDSAGSNLHNDINLGSGTFTLANTGSGQVNFSIVGSVGAPLTIEAGNINFMRSNSVVWVLQAGVVAQGADLTLRATGDITFQGTVINLGPGRLEMSADNEGNGTGTIIAANTPQILVGSLVLRHAAAFPADFMADDSAVTGEADLRFTAVVTQAIHPWMNLGGTSFTLRGDEGEGMRAAVVLTAITIGETTLNYGTTDIDLQAAAITLTADVVLTGGAISLTGALTTATNNLTITASGLLTLNNDITLGTGILTITADERINVPTSIDITASASNIIFTDRLVQSFEVGFTPADSTTSTFGNVTFVPPATPMFAPSPCPVGEAVCSLGTGAALIVDPLLEADTSITLNAGTNALSFSGEGAITITSAAISITAGSIDIGTRSLTITAAGGTITLSVGMITGTGAASLSLDAATIAGLNTSRNPSAITVDVPNISIARNEAFGTAPPVTFGMAVTSLTIEVAAAQTVQGWMVASGRSLDITTSNVLTVDTAITGFILGDSADLTLNGMGGITLTGSGAISLTARDITLSSAGNITFNQNLTLTTEDITLNGAIDGTNGNDDDSDDRNFTVTASGGITLRSDINLGTGDLSITSTFSGGPSPIVISREGGTETAPALVTLSGGNVTLANTSAGGISGPIAGGVGLIVNALDNIILNTAIDGISALTLRADESNSGTGTITNDGTARRIQVGALFLQQAGAFGETSLFASNSSASGDVTLLISRPFNQTIHPWMVGLGGTSFTLRGAGRRRLDTITLPTALTYTGTIELHATTIALGGDLTAGAVILRTNTITRDSTDLVITATTGEITATRIDPSGDAVAGAPTLDSTVTALTLIAQSAFGSSAPFAFGTTLTSLTLQTAAPQTAYSWMGVSGSNVSLTSTGGDITIGGAIDVGTDNDLTFIASGNIVSGTPRPTLTADTVNLELTGADSAFTTTRPFLAASQITTLTITTAAAQDYRVWMRATNRNLTITSPGGIRLGATAINLGTGNLTFNSGFGIRLTNMAGLTITAGNVTFPVGGFIAAQGVDVSQLVVMASGDIVISDTRLPTARVELRADNGNITINPDTVGLPGIRVDFLLMRQMGMFADNFISSTNSDIRELILRTTTAVDQPIYDWMQGAIGDPNNSGTTDGTSFSLRGEGVALNSITTAAAADFGTGTVELHATTINLGGALTGASVALRSNMITGGSADLVAIHAMTGDITSTAINSTGGVGAGRPALATGVTGFSLTRSRTFGGRGSLPFTMTASVLSAITAITLSTRSPQIVLSWMINPDRNLTITSASTVRVNAAIGSDVPGRNFRDGNFSLTSTGGLVRILFGISTGGNLTLIGSTDGINLNSGAGAKTLRGATVTLTGNARSNRALTLDATSGALTLNGDIALTGTRALSLSGSGGIALGGALTLTGGAITLNNAVTGEANLTITASRALTINNSITLTGADLTLALSGAGAIVNGGTATLTASTVSLEQDAVFTTTEPFAFGNTGSLELTTDAAQVVHDWMIADGRNLTVTSALNVVVRSAIVSGARNLGDGNITLVSTGGLVRIFAGISTTGNITLDGNTGINFNDRAAKTLRGAIVTLIGTARSNRDLILTASTVRITQDAAFGETGPGTMLMFGTAPDSLELTTDAAQVVHDWMIADGRNLTVTSAGIVRVTAAIGGSGGRNLGDGSLTLVSTGGLVRILENISTTGNITLNGADGINFNNRTAKTLSGATVTLTGVVVSNRDLALTASGTLRFNNNITLNGMRALSLTSTGGDVRILGNITTGGDLTLIGGTDGINLNSGRAKTLSGANITLTGVVVSNRAVTINASGILRLNNNIALTGTRALSLSGSGGITLGSALTTLSGGAITLRGAVTGTADLTITARGTLTLNNNIDIGTGALTLSGAGVISNGGNIGRNRPRLTASTVSLTQIDAFAEIGPFRLRAGSLMLITDAAQAVHDWMIADGRNLTVTSALNVIVRSAIGDGLGARNLGDGNITLTSTGGLVRIFADISTGGDLTLNGATGINLNGGARILNGAIVTLTGAARSNRALTITASGVLAINNNINIGTGALTLTGANFTFGLMINLAAGSHNVNAFNPPSACDSSTSPSCTVNTP